VRASSCRPSADGAPEWMRNVAKLQPPAPSALTCMARRGLRGRQPRIALVSALACLGLACHGRAASRGSPPANDATLAEVAPSPDAGSGEADASTTCDLSTLPTFSDGHPNSLLNAAEIAAIRERVKAGAEPWATAYKGLIAEANAAKNLAPRSVRTEGNTGADYFTENPYCGWGMLSPCGSDCCDGRINPNADRRDYTAAIAVGHAVRDLGLAYAFTGDASYAAHAVVLIRHWALDSATAMTPKFTTVSSEIELAITIPGMFYGADLIWSYPEWTDRDAFAHWAAALAADVRGKGAATNAQNFGDWRLVLLSMAAIVSEDEALLKYAFDHYKALVPNQINADGELVREIDRTKALYYSMYAADAMAQVCEIARHRGVDLAHFAAANNSGRLERAFDWLAPYLLDPDSWPHDQLTPLTANDSIAAFELAYFTWGKANYRSVLQRFGRPIVEIRTAGPLTLTHGRGAFPWQLGGLASHAMIAADRRSGPAPLTVAFDAGQSKLAGGLPERFHWAFGDGGVSEQSAPSHTFESPGCFTVTLTITRGEEEQTTTLNIRVDPAVTAAPAPEKRRRPKRRTN
jgi:hypothetical protein